MSMSDCMSCQKNVFRFFRRQLLCIIWLLVPTVATSSQFAQCLIQRWLAACLLKTILELQNCTGCYSFPFFMCGAYCAWKHCHGTMRYFLFICRVFGARSVRRKCALYACFQVLCSYVTPRLRVIDCHWRSWQIASSHLYQRHKQLVMLCCSWHMLKGILLFNYFSIRFQFRWKFSLCVRVLRLSWVPWFRWDSLLWLKL